MGYTFNGYYIESKKEKKERKRDLAGFKQKMRIRKVKSYPYKKQLKDKRWFAFRKKVFSARGCACESCGSKEHLQVHHIKYRNYKYAWEYPIKDVRVLCRRCHAKEHNKPL